MMLLGLIPVAASLVLALGGPALSRCLAPRLAAPLLTLLALATSLATGVVLCVAAFGAAAQLPPLARIGRWSSGALRSGGPGLGWGLLAGAAASALLAAALVFAARAVRDLTRARRACRQLSAGVDRFVIARDDRPLAYAVPHPGGAIVISTGMLRLLSADERRALLAHEDAHLRQHHAAYVLLAELAARANPLLRPLARQVRLAVELRADELAADEVGDRRVVASALARASLAARGSATGPLGSLAIAETDACTRVRALLEPPRRRRPWAAAAALALTLASSATAISLMLATHQRIEIAQLAYAQAHDPAPALVRGHGEPGPDGWVPGSARRADGQRLEVVRGLQRAAGGRAGAGPGAGRPV
jgi:Zn-dependent protease with chaperone function